MGHEQPTGRGEGDEAQAAPPGDERCGGCTGEHRARGTVVAALAGDPEAPAMRVVMHNRHANPSFASQVIGRSWPMSLTAILLSSMALSACGGDSAPSGAAETSPTATVLTAPPATTATTAPPTTPTATTGVPPASATTGTDTVAPEERPGGAGDEEPTRIPAQVTIDGATATPATITVAAFLPIELRIVAHDGVRRATLDAPGGGTIDLTGGEATRRLDGLKPGRYTLTTDSGARMTLRVTPGGEVGP